MGVPKFAAWLRKKYPLMVVNRCPSTTHGLYIDLNGLIHPCCHSEYDPSVAQLSVEAKLQRICHEVEVLVATVRPRELLYIATDGVAPRAKMNQQRARRYMSKSTPINISTTNINNNNNNNNNNNGYKSSGSGSYMTVGGSGGAKIVEECLREFLPHELEQVEEDLEDVRQSLMQDALYGHVLSADDQRKEEMTLNNNMNHKVNGNNHNNGNNNDNNNNNPIFDMDLMEEDIFPSVESDIIEYPPDNVEFDSNCISPGTEFMTKVANAVLAMVEDRITSGNPMWASLHVVLSADNTPGEGEHKIIDFLRTQSSYSGFNGKGAHVIVGLDADLVFLALSLHMPHIFILRDVERNPYNMNKKKEAKDRKKAKKEKKHKKNSNNDNIEEEKDEDNSEIDNMFASIENESINESIDNNSNDNSSNSEIVANTTYEYFDIDVVGSHLISELHGLCKLKGFMPANENAFPLDTLASSNNYYFFRHAGFADGAIRDPTISKNQTNEKEKTSWKNFMPCDSPANSKIIDDFIVLAMLLGNDFLPRLPSAFCGESALDNLLELYVTDVLPYGFLTLGNHEINLLQLQRLFESYAKIEAVKFRRFELNNNTITVQEAAEPLYSHVDDNWRKLYLTSTGLINNFDEACAKYVEGLRFIWRYYSSNSISCSWSWYYPFHHGPFALDLALFLKKRNIDTLISLLPSPPLETSPPDIYVQLLCILPPTSYTLLPSVLGEVMLNPPEELMDTFPTKWCVDYAGAYDKEHLAAVLIPFANAPRLEELTKKAQAQFSEEEKQRGERKDYHLVLSSPTAEFQLHGDINKISTSEASQLHLQREGVIYMQLRDSPPVRGRPKTYSCTATIPWVTCDSEGKPNKRERHRKSRREKREMGMSKEEGKYKDNKTDRTKENGIITEINKGPSFGAYLIGFAVVSLFTTMILIPWKTVSFWQIFAVNLGSIFFSILLGIAVHEPVIGSSLRRNNIRMTYVDWLCAECLSLNFTKRDKCFVCRAPFDEHRCLAVFSSTQSTKPPLYDPDHSSYIETVGIEIPKRKGSSS